MSKPRSRWVAYTALSALCLNGAPSLAGDSVGNPYPNPRCDRQIVASTNAIEKINRPNIDSLLRRIDNLQVTDTLQVSKATYASELDGSLAIYEIKLSPEPNCMVLSVTLEAILSHHEGDIVQTYYVSDLMVGNRSVGQVMPNKDVLILKIKGSWAWIRADLEQGKVEGWVKLKSLVPNRT